MGHSAKEIQCCNCRGIELSTRVATFSYRKALDFPMFRQSWVAAERYLRQCSRWIFIGYSLPAADFEFKHLLKRIELSRPERPEIIVVSGGEDEALQRTLRNYQGLFGSFIKEGSTFLSKGLIKSAVRLITTKT